MNLSLTRIGRRIGLMVAVVLAVAAVVVPVAGARMPPWAYSLAHDTKTTSQSTNAPLDGWAYSVFHRSTFNSNIDPWLYSILHRNSKPTVGVLYAKPTSTNGFDWRSVGVGIGAAGLLAIGLAAAFVVTRRNRVAHAR